jgi:YHS domain-containing protein
MKKVILFLIVGIGIGAAVFVAMRDSESFNQINTTAENIAIKGFDTVEYFNAQKAVEGNAQFSLVWKGAKWYFANTANLEKFKQNPEQFAPQFGGYCAFAVSKGYTADGDPNAWKIVDGKLYLNYSPKVKELWEENQTAAIENGQKNWQEFQTKKPEYKR